MSKRIKDDLHTSFKDIINGDTDYPIHIDITLSELVLFLWAMGRTIWYLIFGVVSYNFDYVLPEAVWIAFFAVVSTTHLIGMYLNNSSLRITAIMGYTLAWGTLAIFAIQQAVTSAAFPSYAILTLTSLLVINGISRSKHRH